MPELAEVEYFRKQWDPGLGQRVERVLLHREKRLFRGTDTTALVQGITRRRFQCSSARGKRMLFQFSGRHWLGIHLGMSGKLRAEPPGFRPEKHDHLALLFAKVTLVLRDARLFGRVQHHHGAKPPPWWPLQIPEIASREFNRTFFDNFLRRHQRAPIKAVLLMQEGFLGVGNWMADEILWRAQVHPARPTGDLRAGQRERLYLETREVARRSLLTIGRDWTDPPRNWLIHQRWKAGGICPQHRLLLRRETIGGRTTVWCPKCQRP
jgi:formamidopyrimidine-DNA glycosylase